MIAEAPVGNTTSLLSKIESFLNDAAYREAIENSANYNTRLCIERRLRMPFLDSQTGMAQNHCHLFMSPRQRIPGLLEGQIYTYPSKRWRKKRRQYLTNFLQPRRKEVDPEIDLHTISTIENPAVCNEDSKESVSLPKEEPPKVMPPENWYYDELELHEIEAFEDPDPDSDMDYEESYTKRKKKPKKLPKTTNETPAPKKPKGPRGRKKSASDALTDAEKPFACELCGARYKTRPGLTYHNTHSHKERAPEEPSDENSSCTPEGEKSSPTQSVQQDAGWTKFQDSYLTFLSAPGISSSSNSNPNSRRPGNRQAAPSPAPISSTPSQHVPLLPVIQPSIMQPLTMEEPPGTVNISAEKKISIEGLQLIPDDKERAVPSPYCDFCLGDASENKKTGHSEELVSCSDCGRSATSIIHVFHHLNTYLQIPYKVTLHVCSSRLI